MEKLVVSNFLNIKHVELEITKFTILIGEQAQGKSVLAKLLYFFKDFWIDYKLSILNELRKDTFEKELLDKFTAIFPEYTWVKSNKNIEIKYCFDDYIISLETKKKAKGDLKLYIEYSEYLNKKRRKAISDIRKAVEINNKSEAVAEKVDISSIVNDKQTYVNSWLKSNLFDQASPRDVTFVPSGRSFFAYLEKNIFSLLARDFTIDYFLKEFGSFYERIKSIYLSSWRYNNLEYPELIDIFRNIVGGFYMRQDNEDWIYTDEESQIKVSNASSGQQEVLPMVMFLFTLTRIANELYLFVEEPEAHLFPTSQQAIIDLISLVFNETEQKHRFFITTHSPYILSALNNHLQLSNTLKAIEKRPEAEQQKLKDELARIMPLNRAIDVEDVRIYSIQNGAAINIINEDNSLIHENIVDDAFDEFAEIFDKLVDLEVDIS